MLINSSDGRMVVKLNQEMVQVIKTDMVSERGLREVIDGEAELLTYFDFNINGKLGTSIYAYTAMDRPSGKLSVVIPSFVYSNMIVAQGGTKFKMFIFEKCKTTNV